MAERLANLGYLALKKEATEGTPVIPDVFVPLYSESFVTSINLNEDNPIVGLREIRYQSMRGQRDHQGDITVLGEPNTAGYLFDMLLKKGSTTGAGPYTHPFTLGESNSYTIEFLKGQVPMRYFGVKAKNVSVDFDDNKMTLTAGLTARKSFSVAEIGAISGAGPFDITLATDYGPSPTDGLVDTDIIRIYKADGTTIDTLITTVDDATGLTIPASPDLATVAAGDLVTLRGLTVSLSLQDPFLWARSEFRFGATASAALSATHSPAEPGSKWNVINQILPDEGAKRSGSFDPATLPRGQGDIEASVKLFFDTPDDENRFRSIPKRALVIRHFGSAISSTDQEIRVTINHFNIATKPVPLSTGELIFEELELKAEYDDSDAQMFDVTVINNVSSI